MKLGGTSWTTVGVFLWQSGMLGLMCVRLLSQTACQIVVLSDLTGFCYTCFQAVTAQVVRDVCTKYIYDKCPAVVALGAFFGFFCPGCCYIKMFLQWFLNSQFVPLSSLLQAPSNSCQTTTGCAVLCTGWGFKMSSVPVFPPVSRVDNICLPPSLQELKPDVSRWCQDWIGSHYHLSLLTLGYHSYY